MSLIIVERPSKVLYHTKSSPKILDISFIDMVPLHVMYCYFYLPESFRDKTLIMILLLVWQIQELCQSMGHHAMLHPPHLPLDHHTQWPLVIHLDSPHLNLHLRAHNKIPLMVHLMAHLTIHPIVLPLDPTFQKNL